MAGDQPLPHIGWNDVEPERESIITVPGEPADFYFVHSYVYEPADPSVCLARTSYGESFCSVAGTGNIWGVQFHPEKSQAAGRQLVERFLERSH